MSWEERLLGDDELRRYVHGDLNFPTRVRALIVQQLEAWPMLREAVEGLNAAKYKPLAVNGSEVYAQFNPERIVSTAARVDAATIKQRPCFLCVDNLPPEEKGIAFGEQFVALCNPFPVLRDHLVVAARAHMPQTIHGNFGVLLDLAAQLGGGWFTLYNGPRCGASAPDHLHFQACAVERLPIFSALDRPFVNALIARESDRVRLIEWFNGVIRELGATADPAEEPMMNIVVTFAREQWTVIVYPRSRHRPACYEAEGDAKLTVSPAAIDLSGVVVVPHPDHFSRITAEDVAKIYAEVMFDGDRFMRLARRVGKP